jgi:serine/threonine protein kinase
MTGLPSEYCSHIQQLFPSYTSSKYQTQIGSHILPMRTTTIVKTSARDKYAILSKAEHGFRGGSQNVGVYVVRHRPTGETCVEKRVTACQNGASSIYSEINTMVQLRDHPNIVTIMESDTAHLPETYGSIWMRHCELGSLDTLVMRYNARNMHLQDEGFLWKVFWDISQALCYLSTGQDHKKTRDDAMQGRPVEGRGRGWNAVRHRDVKLANVLMTWSRPSSDNPMSGYPTVLLCDFGCSVRSTDISLNTPAARMLQRANVAFEPPESSYSGSGDVYGLGLILHCLALMQQVPDVVISDRESSPFGYFSHFHGELESLVGNCLIPSPADRATQVNLPMMVWEGYQDWRSDRSDNGESLPAWAFD